MTLTLQSMDGIILPPDLEQFATARDAARAAFRASVEAAQREGDQDGFHSLDDVLAELDGIIDEEERAQG